MGGRVNYGQVATACGLSDYPVRKGCGCAPCALHPQRDGIPRMGRTSSSLLSRRLPMHSRTSLKPNASVYVVLPTTLWHTVYATLLCSALCLQLPINPANAAESGVHASVVSTSRWWNLDCGQTARNRQSESTTCTLTVKLRGVLDGSRLQLVRNALERRDSVRHALRRQVEFRVDIDSQGGEIFSALEIGRTLRAERASVSVGEGAACISSCVLLLIGAVERSISPDARLGIHRPSVRALREGGPRRTSKDKIVEAISEQLVVYAQQMNVPRKIIDESMLIPPERVKLLSPSELAGYGIYPVDPVELEERRARSQSMVHPATAQGE